MKRKTKPKPVTMIEFKNVKGEIIRLPSTATLKELVAHGFHPSLVEVGTPMVSDNDYRAKKP